MFLKYGLFQGSFSLPWLHEAKALSISADGSCALFLFRETDMGIQQIMEDLEMKNKKQTFRWVVLDLSSNLVKDPCFWEQNRDFETRCPISISSNTHYAPTWHQAAFFLAWMCCLGPELSTLVAQALFYIARSGQNSFFLKREKWSELGKRRRRLALSVPFVLNVWFFTDSLIWSIEDSIFSF